MFFVPQVSTDDCGWASLKMVLAIVHKDKRYLFIPQDEKHGFYSYRDLVETASQYNVNCTGFLVKDKEEFKACKFLPCIVTIESQNRKHAVVVRKIRGNTLYILDPNLGPRKMKLKDFILIWDGTGIGVNHVEPCPYSYEDLEPINKKKLILSYLLQILSGISFILGIYFISPEGDYVIPIIILSCGVIIELLNKLYLFKLMNDYDDYCNNKVFDISKSRYFDYYLRIQKFKKNRFSFGMNLCYYAFLSIFSIFVIILNGINNVFLVMLVVALTLIDALIITPIENRKLKEIAIEEESIKTISKKEQLLAKIQKLQNSSYKFAKIVSFKKLVGLFMFLLSSSLICYFSNSFTLINVLFYLCLQLFFYDNLKPILTYESRKREYNVSKVELMNVLFDRNK